MLKIKKSIYALIAIGEPITDNKHINAILDGLLDEYDNFVINVSMRSESYSVAELEALLMTQEDRIERNKKIVENSTTNQFVTANIAQSSFSTNHQNQNKEKNKVQEIQAEVTTT